MLNQRFLLIGLTLSVLLTMSACANSPMGDAVEKSLAPDPQLQTEETATPAPSPSPSPDQSIQLPSDFPLKIPRYPNAQLETVTESEAEEKTLRETRWISEDPSNAIQAFYQQAFNQQPWRLTQRPQEEGQGTFVATDNNLQVTITLAPSQQPGVTTEFTIQYQSLVPAVATTPTPTTTISPSPAPPDPSPSAEPTKPEKTAEIPAELRQSVLDVAKLGVLTLSTTGTPEKSTTLANPNQVITRRLYARWLVNANNRIHGNRPAKQIRLGVSSDASIFEDVPTSDPDFPEIQGLAQAGLIPSPLTGDTGAGKFRPDDPLTREQLLLWKVPLDLGRKPGTATVDLIQQRWGFQDTAKIDPQVLGAILVDFDNGDFSNIRRVFGYTTLLQPKKTVTQAEAAAALWYFGFQGDGVSAADVLPSQKSN